MDSTSCIDKMITLTFGSLDFIIRVALIPSRTGMVISISTTSGLCVLTAWMPYAPSPASATICKFGCFSRMLRIVHRNQGLSSTTTIRRGVDAIRMVLGKNGYLTDIGRISRTIVGIHGVETVFGRYPTEQLWSQAGVSRAYASLLSRYSGGGPGSLRSRLFPRCAIEFP